MSKKIKKMMPVVVSALVVIVLAVFAMKSNPENTVSKNWTTYHNDTFGYSFEYPDNLFVRDEGVNVWMYDESKKSQYVHVLTQIGKEDFGMTVVVNPLDGGMCEGSDRGIPDHTIGDMTFGGCEYTSEGYYSGSETAAFARNGDSYRIYIGYPIPLRDEAYRMAASFRLDD